MATRTHDNTGALYAYIAKIDEIRAACARLTAYTEENGNVVPSDIHWGHVGSISSIASLLNKGVAEMEGTA